MIALIPEEKAQFVARLRDFRIGEWNVILALEQNFLCAYCDKDLLESFDNYNSWQWDHIIPQSRDGAHGPENIAVCCKTCNWLKNAYLPSGDTKSERILDACQYIKERRAKFEAEVIELRELVDELRGRPRATDIAPLGNLSGDQSEISIQG